ncbi:hypothetical protein [uncultured Methanomethylovorans sp.]|uniref:hypothetical protein n=1 Tax=uncultured Methanomethylovorans sp. TaxID=183759 RepID=UPI002AA71DED|nr:hypothetical protein [uncultured Methanomethylovorans sp.]
MVPATLAAQDNSQQQKMYETMHGEKINTRDPAGFSLDNETFESQKERMLEQINDTISKIETGEINNENITAEMLDNATTQLEDAKTIVENAGDITELNEARELVHSAMETIGLAPVKMMDRQGAPEEESFDTEQERMLGQINDTISFISLIDSGEIDDENITAEMMDNATTQLEDAKTIVQNAENVEDLKEARELIHSAIETLGMGPVMMGKPDALQDDKTFETEQERMLEQVNNTISKIKSDIENIDELDNKNITEDMLTTALTELEEAKTLITNAEDEKDLKEAMEQMHSAMEELGIGPVNERGMEPGQKGKTGTSPGNESSNALYPREFTR